MNFTTTLSAFPRLPAIDLRGPLSWMLSATLVALAATFTIPRDVPLTQLQVRGTLDHVKPEDVRAAASGELAGSFFTADLTGVRAAVEKLPWVSRASVERVWPGAVAVRVWERQPAARWNEDGLLDTHAVAFVPRAADLPAGLPMLGGTPGHEKEVGAAWNRIAPVLAETPFRLEGLVEDARGEWTARTTAGVELRMGQGAPDRHLAFLTGGVRKALEGRWSSVQYVDLRYTNGFVVGWVQEGDGKAAAGKSTNRNGNAAHAAGGHPLRKNTGAAPARSAATEKR